MRRLAALLVVVAALAAPAAAAAHPLGNFTVNRYSEIVLSGDAVYVRYALDLAEIPTFQLRAQARRPGFAASLASRLEVRVDGRRARLRVLDSRTTVRPGAGGLETLRFEAVYEVSERGRSLAFRDRNFPERRGWREVVAAADRGARIERSTVPSESASAGLTVYPADLLREPLDVVSAAVTLSPGTLPGRPPTIGEAAPGARDVRGFEALVSGELTAEFVLVSLALALFWGAAHAFSPGHGKAIVAGYLVGTRGTPRHAVLLGAIVTVTHTIGVFALGLVTLALSAFIVPEQLYPWLNLVAALLVVAVGVAVLRARLREWLHARAHARGDGHHHHHHGHGHHHRHPEPGGGLRGLVATGVSGGIVPCPTALVVLLAAISLHRVGYGLVLILAFSVGLAASVTGIGLLAVTAKRAFTRVRLDGPLVRSLPAFSAVVVLGLGVLMTLRALPALA